MLFIYTGSVDYRYNARGQLFEQLTNIASRSFIEVGYFATVDHLFSTQANRQTLMQCLLPWLETVVCGGVAEGAKPTLPASAMRLSTPARDASL